MTRTSLRSGRKIGRGHGPVYDLAVIGLGAVGSAALYAAAKAGARVIGIDQFAPPHAMGSSHGESRIMRQAIGEGANYVPLVLRSNEVLEEIEAHSELRLLERCGFIFITRDDHGTAHHGKRGFMDATARAAVEHGIDHSILDHREIQDRFPQFIGLVGDERAYYEPGGGYVRPELCIEAFLSLARADGAILSLHTKAEEYCRENDGFRVRTNNGVVLASKIILAAGPWLPGLAPRTVGRHAKVYSQTVYWYGLRDGEAYRAGSTPTFIWTHGLDSQSQFYGFPPIGTEIKVAAEQYSESVDPQLVPGKVRQDELELMDLKHVQGRLSGVSSLPTRAKRCLYTVTKDSGFIIDEETAGAWAVSACSGHGFKHAPAVGEAVAFRALGLQTDLDLGMFSASRFQ